MAEGGRFDCDNGYDLNMDRDLVIKEALALSTADRAAVISTLLDSLNGDDAASLDEASVAEFERRLEAYQRGEMNALSLEETMRMLRERRAG